MRILHIISSYPDPIAGETRASLSLLELVPEFEHCVYSFKRTGWRPGIWVTAFDDSVGQDHRAIAYGAPPKGLFLERHLDHLADWIMDDMERRNLKPDLIHAHKLSTDGLVAQRIAARLGAPMMVSLQGNTDTMIVSVKRDLRPRWRTLWRDAAVVFPFAPWALTRLEAMLDARTGPVRMLPCPTSCDAVIAPRAAPPLFRTAFNIVHHRNKNIARLVRALARAAVAVPDIRLEVIGGGDGLAFADVARMIDRTAPGLARMVGSLPHGKVQALFNASCGFALVSQRESYGMVYAEALLAGAPCLFSRGRAIDGYFEEGGVVMAVDPGDEAEIADAMVRLVREQDGFKARLAQLQQNGGLALLRRDAIADAYRAGVEEAAATRCARLSTMPS